MIPIANQSGAVYGPTLGICRNMQEGIDAQGYAVPFSTAESLGGGDLNGTASTSIIFHQAGTNATRLQMPRIFASPGNWCGIV